MAKILDIVQEPNSVLRAVARDVSLSGIQTPRVQRLINDMKKTLASTPDGVGLAAPQVNEPVRIFIVSEEAEEVDKTRKKKEIDERNYERREWKYYVYINPAVKNRARSKSADAEGCLSARGKYGLVRRDEKITVTAYDETGKKFTRGSSRFFARVVQHELDHLDGVLFMDKAERLLKKTSNE